LICADGALLAAKSCLWMLVYLHSRFSIHYSRFITSGHI